MSTEVNEFLNQYLGDPLEIHKRTDYGCNARIPWIRRTRLN